MAGLKSLFLVCLLICGSSLDAQKLKLQLEGGVGMVGSTQVLFNLTEQNHYSLKHNEGIKLSSKWGRIEAQVGWINQEIGTTYQYTNDVILGHGAKSPKIDTRVAVSKLLIYLGWYFDLKNDFYFLPFLGGSYLNSRNYFNETGLKKGIVNVEDNRGKKYQINYVLTGIIITSDKFSIDYGFTLGKLLTDRWSIYLNFVMQNNLKHLMTQQYGEKFIDSDLYDYNLIQSKDYTPYMNLGVGYTLWK